MSFIEKGYTDERYSRLLQYGVEGIHYNVVDGAVVNNPDEAFPTVTGYMNYVYFYGNSFVTESWGENYKRVYDALYTKLHTQNQSSPYDGFSFDSTNVTAQMANLEDVRAEYAIPLSCGVIQSSLESDLATLQKAMNAAGIAEYMAEYQRQLDTFSGK